MEIMDARSLKEEAERKIGEVLIELEKKVPGLYVNGVKVSRAGSAKLTRYARGEYLKIEIEMGF